MLNNQYLRVIGLTGNIACGKSAVSDMLRKLGAIIIDADKIARKLVAKDAPAWHKIKDCFGDGFFTPNGEIDRKKLGEAVFGDRALKDKLDAIMFPAIRNEIEIEMAAYEKESEKIIIVIDAALLLEVGWDDLADEVWLVKIDPDIQLMRLMARDGLTRVQAQKRINSQMSQDLKLMAADRIIDNSSSLHETEEQVKNLWREIY
jgi:dephospho-CoA kinase